MSCRIGHESEKKKLVEETSGLTTTTETKHKYSISPFIVINVQQVLLQQAHFLCVCPVVSLTWLYPHFLFSYSSVSLQGAFAGCIDLRFQKHHLDLTASFTAVGSDCKYKWFVFVLGDGYD